jgi:hypothetical protein
MVVRMALCGLLALTLVACGDESADGSPTSAAEDPAAPPPPPPPANGAPVIAGSPAVAVTAGDIYSFLPSATDSDNDALTFSISGKPQWASFDTVTGELRGTPADGDVGMSGDIEITVTDGKATDSIGPFKINVTARSTSPTPPPVNSPPTISGSPATTVVAGTAYSFTPGASDPDGDTLNFAIAGRPQWATFSTSTGRLSGTPTSANVGTVSNIRISVSDGKASTPLPAFSIQVQAPPNRPPTITGTPGTTSTVGAAWSFQPSASDPDGNSLTYSIQNKPAWATFSTTNGRLNGTPATSNVGTYSNIRISVSDGRLSAALPAFALQVNAGPNRAPTITGTASPTATVGSGYSFTPTANDPDGDTLSFSVQNKPAWATFSITNGRLSGSPTAPGSHAGIVITVSDGKAPAVALAAFSITVGAAPNGAPTISGSPSGSITAGSAYSFTPTASDPNGDTLTFSIQNKPSWATFNTQTGRLSGTPAAADAGTYNNVMISVSDGNVSASLPGFSITVNANSNGSATLTWSAPTENADGSTLTDLAGYRISYGTSASSLTQTVQVTNASVTTYVIENLSPGTWYFSVKTYSSAGTESIPSRTVSTQVQ